MPSRGPVAEIFVGKIGNAAGGLFPLLIVYVIAFATLHKANALLGAIAISVYIIALTQPSYDLQCLTENRQ